MSVYDFNNQDHINNDGASHTVANASNGTQTRQYQDNTDYLNRSYLSSHQVQLTRPASKTAMLIRQRRAMLEQLSCHLCKGYLIDATTVDECMDSFCKSCIVIYLRNHNNCPKCGTLIHKTNPLSAIRSDKVLQDIVYKLVPGLYDDEMRRRREFYKNRFVTSVKFSSSSEEDDGDVSTSSSNEWIPHLSGEQQGIVPHPKPFYKFTDNIDLSIEPQIKGGNSCIYYDNKRQSIVTCFTGNFQQQQLQLGQLFSAVESQQFKTYLRCPAKLNVSQLKKFIATKFNICKDDTIHLLYLNDSLKDDYSLIDIAYIYDWRGIEHMRLYYIIERDSSVMINSRTVQQLETDLPNNQAKTRQSVGTSTQTVKRVCVDPNPKYFEDTRVNSVSNHNNIGKGTNINGRMMRPRNEVASTPNKVVSSTQAVQPRPQRASREVANVVKGMSNRGMVVLRAQATRTPLTGAVTSANDDSSRLTRSSPRKHGTESPSGSLPKININFDSMNRTREPSSDKNIVGTCSRVDHNQKEAVPRDIIINNNNNNNNTSNSNYNSKPINNSHNNNNNDANSSRNVIINNNRNTFNGNNNNNGRQFAQYTKNGTSTPNTNSSRGQNQPQSSLVTLASFMETRNNHVVAVSTNSGTSLSGNFKNAVASGSSQRIDLKSTEVKNGNNNSQPTRSSQDSPRLALRFVTERGITIIRPMNSQEEANHASAVAASSANTSTSTTSSSNMNKVSSVPALPMPQTSQSGGTGGLMRQSSSYQYSSPHRPLGNPAVTHQVSSTPTSSSSGGVTRQTTASTTTTGSSSGPTSGHEGISPRHLVKVKPVYKTFVDPTKLKSPNFKKLNYTARH